MQGGNGRQTAATIKSLQLPMPACVGEASVTDAGTTLRLQEWGRPGT